MYLIKSSLIILTFLGFFASIDFSFAGDTPPASPLNAPNAPSFPSRPDQNPIMSPLELPNPARLVQANLPISSQQLPSAARSLTSNFGSIFSTRPGLIQPAAQTPSAFGVNQVDSSINMLVALRNLHLQSPLPLESRIVQTPRTFSPIVVYSADCQSNRTASDNAQSILPSNSASAMEITEHKSF